MLKSFKMSADNFLTTLISFNVGVELAQIVIVSGVVFLLFFIKCKGLILIDLRKTASKKR
jgi:hypothetical protein